MATQDMLLEFREGDNITCILLAFKRNIIKLNKKGLDIEYIIIIGGWGSFDVVFRYIRSVKLEDSPKTSLNAEKSRQFEIIQSTFT